MDFLWAMPVRPGYFYSKDRLGYTVSMQKLIVKSDHHGLRYKPNAKVWFGANCNVFAHISSKIEVSIFVVVETL
jgi:hypothetical protein